MKEEERKAQILALWHQRPDGKRTKNDAPAFYRDMGRAFPHVLNRRRGGDAYQNTSATYSATWKGRRRLSQRSLSLRMDAFVLDFD
jgi:hypothetical protein